MRLIEATVEKAQAMGVDPELGLTQRAVDESRREHGDNRLPEVRGKTVLDMLLDALKDKTLLILIGAAVLALGVELVRARIETGYVAHYVDGLAILAAVVIASVVATLNEARAQKEFRSLAKAREDVPIKVLRDGEVTEISIFDLVVSDVVHIGAGDRLPADGLLLKGADVGVDQSMITGESLSVDKGADEPKLLAGSIMTSGSGSMLVTAVGVKTEMGKLHAKLAAPDEDLKTPLQERLSDLADKIGLFGLGSAILTFAALAVSAFVRGELPFALSMETTSALLQFAIVAVTIVVVAVPEGLPVAVTISLAYSVRKMARDKSLVRHLESCETMGAATVICADKTGTLTQNRMAVRRIWIDGKMVDPDALSEGDRGVFSDLASINSTAFLERTEEGLKYIGNPTECALLRQADDYGKSFKQIRQRADLLHQFVFSSDRKRMSTVVKEGSRARVLVKGAPETVLGLAEHIHSASGTRPMTGDDRTAIENAIAELSSSGERTLALAYRSMEAEEAASLDGPAGAERDLVFFSLVGIHDPLRTETKDAIATCRRAGIDVRMVTGDNRIIAETIARELDLVGPDDLILEGPEFQELSDEALNDALPRLRVLARSVPTDKHRLVGALQKNSEVVAVTGDGTNDAPALKLADVGFSMGVTGTEVAKEASDIVILDDNFASIVRAIRWGRSIFENIRKFLQFQLTVNVAALLTAFLAAVFGFGIPLNTVQLLWVNLIMDSLAALALAVEPPSERLLEQRPHGRHEPLITKPMWISILLTSSVMVATLMAIMWTDWIVAEDVAYQTKLTFVFNTFVLMQLFNEVNARSTRFDRSVFDRLTESHLFITVVLTTLVLQVLIVQFGGEFFRTSPLDFEMWLWSIAIGASVLLVGAGIRLVGRSSGGAQSSSV